MAESRQRWFRRHPRIAGVLFSIGSLLALDVIAGTTLHAFGIYPIPAEQHYRTPHPVYHHDLDPNSSYASAQSGPNRYSLHVNSLGFRDREVREVSLSKTTRRRILLLGDSFTEGVSLRWEDTFAGMLQEDLREEGCEILNAGVVSYSPIIYYCKARDLVQRRGLEIDEVIVLIDLSDIFDETKHVLDEETASVRAKGPMIDDYLKRFVANHTILLHAIRTYSRGFRQRIDSPGEASQKVRWVGSWTLDPEAWKAYGEEGLAKATANMDRLAEFLEGRRIGLTVVIYPWPDQIRRRALDDRHVRHWTEWAAAKGCGFLDLYPAFINDTPAQEVIDGHFIEGDVHWNREGNRVVADALLDYLR